MKNTTTGTEWVNPTLYPFKNHYIQLDSGKMHYVDEGEGEVFLFVHGTPAWSFLYRQFITDLSKNYRCIAIDHLGFGLSDKPANFLGTPQAHSKNLTEFIQKMNLTDITLVVHDFGGPIGLGSAIANPTLFKKIILFNSWLWETKNEPAIRKADRILKSAMGRLLYLRLNFSPRVLMKKAFRDKKKLPGEVHRHYIRPFPDKKSRYALLHLGLSLAGSSDWYEELWTQLDRIRSVPWLIIWGTADPFITTAYLDKWRQNLPDATVRELDCGHFVQEERPQECLAIMKNWLSH